MQYFKLYFAFVSYTNTFDIYNYICHCIHIVNALRYEISCLRNSGCLGNFRRGIVWGNESARSMAVQHWADALRKAKKTALISDGAHVYSV